MLPETGQELLRLVSALCEGQLSDAEHARLDALLGQDVACRRLYLEYLDMHARLLTHPLQKDEGRRHTDQGDRQTVPFSVLRPPSSHRGRAQQAVIYALVSVGTLAASLLVQVFLFPARGPEAAPPGPGETAKAPAYVATLAQAADCVWETEGPARRTGSRLLSGELRLSKGLARLHFDGGSDLVLEGPATLRLESATAATVVRGQVVFQGNETAGPFQLRTPSSTLVDFGTEYAVAVGPEGEEVHVFDGEVHRTPRTPAGRAGPEQLTAGQARRYGRAPESPGRSVPLDQGQFKRQVEGAKGPPADPMAGLLAYEGFDYADADVLEAGKANGGRGWAGPWKVDFARPLVEGDPARLTLNVREGLTRPGAAGAAGGCFEYTGFTKCFRRLAEPIRLDIDGVYYLSFLFRRAAPSDEAPNAVAVLLWTEEDERQPQNDLKLRLNVGVGGPNELFTHVLRAGARTPLPLSYGVTYLLVAKIIAGGANPDQVFLRVYGPEDAVEREEPGSWSLVGPAFESDLVFDWLQLHVNSKRRQTIDEVRLGTTWESASAPWVAAGAGGKNGRR